jgi:hypothetical protein
VNGPDHDALSARFAHHLDDAIAIARDGAARRLSIHAAATGRGHKRMGAAASIALCQRATPAPHHCWIVTLQQQKSEWSCDALLYVRPSFMDEGVFAVTQVRAGEKLLE